MSEKEIKLGNNIQEFEEIFGNVPIKDLDKIRKYIADNYVSLDLYNKEKEKNKKIEEYIKQCDWHNDDVYIGEDILDILEE